MVEPLCRRWPLLWRERKKDFSKMANKQGKTAAARGACDEAWLAQQVCKCVVISSNTQQVTKKKSQTKKQKRAK